MAPSDSRSVNHCGHGHLACKFPINVTVPRRGSGYRLSKCDGALADPVFDCFGYRVGKALTINRLW